MKLTKEHNILIVGLGLLGGSYAKALSRRGYRVRAITKEPEDLAFALEKGWIQGGSHRVEPELVGQAQVVIFALYPHVLTRWIEENQHLFQPGAILTDVTGVKQGVVDKVQQILRPDVEFIGAHPMAGRERSGVQNSDDSIFEGANYVVTPTDSNTPQAIELCRHLGQVLGFARISQLSPPEHDRVIAFVSQLTHCIAMGLMTCQQMEHLEEYTGDSFRDLTRIARMNDQMWSELFLLNRQALIEQIQGFEEELKAIRCLLETGDREGLRQKMQASTKRRELFDKPTPNHQENNK